MCSKPGCASMACRAACMWTGTASTGAKAWRPTSLAGKEPQTQFGRAMKTLGVELILANTPQAKGRVERMNGTRQDRLVKELRLAGISDMESANRFLDGKYLRAFNRQFARAAASPVDVHRAALRNLNEELSWEAERVVQGDWTVACAGQRYQLDRQHEALSLVRRQVIVRTLRNGRVQLVYRSQTLKWRTLPAGTVRRQPPAPKGRKIKTKLVGPPPSLSHPWRQLGAGAGAAVLEGNQGRGKPNKDKQPTKGTFSRELTGGHF